VFTRVGPGLPGPTVEVGGEIDLESGCPAVRQGMVVATGSRACQGKLVGSCRTGTTPTGTPAA
jgi:hypothetical protein